MNTEHDVSELLMERFQRGVGFRTVYLGQIGIGPRDSAPVAVFRDENLDGIATAGGEDLDSRPLVFLPGSAEPFEHDVRSEPSQLYLGLGRKGRRGVCCLIWIGVVLSRANSGIEVIDRFL